MSEQVHNPVWEHIEITACILRFGGRSVLTAFVYRPPGSTFRYSHRISEAVEVLSDIPADQYLICGDFNYPKIDWQNYVISETNNDIDVTSKEIRFYDDIQNSFLHQHVTEPTR